MELGFRLLFCFTVFIFGFLFDQFTAYIVHSAYPNGLGTYYDPYCVSICTSASSIQPTNAILDKSALTNYNAAKTIAGYSTLQYQPLYSGVFPQGYNTNYAGGIAPSGVSQGYNSFYSGGSILNNNYWPNYVVSNGASFQLPLYTSPNDFASKYADRNSLYGNIPSSLWAKRK
ncbi:hypothetical protein Ddc_11450 [Ditylenchus destructor]|nr:hypothetical protein Ddc_11450 [Ditylenchus destructor]